MKRLWRRSATQLLTFGLLIVLVLFVTSEGWACPTCKDGVSTGANHQGMVKGYFFSILFMMSMPFFILSAMCTYFYFLVRRARAESATAVSANVSTFSSATGQSPA